MQKPLDIHEENEEETEDHAPLVALKQLPKIMKTSEEDQPTTSDNATRTNRCGYACDIDGSMLVVLMYRLQCSFWAGP